jgi:hypothetical protein
MKLHYIKPLETISARKGSLQRIFSDFVRIVACCLSPRHELAGESKSIREQEYLETIKAYDKRELELFQQAFTTFIDEAGHHEHRDILGNTYLEWASKGDKQARGEFYTPPEVAEMMAMLTLDAPEIIASGKPVRICEPACGAGTMLLAMAKLFAPDHWHLPRFTAIDLNPVACDMAFINTTLWSIPCEIIRGNALWPKSTDQRFVNLHWLRVGEEQIRLFRQLLRPPETTGSAEFIPPAPASPIKPFYTQGDLFAA